MAAYKKLNSGFLPFVQKEQVTSPYTDIQNRAKVDASLKTIMGVERIHVNSFNKLSKELGPNGETVFQPDSGDSRIRFVGDWIPFFGSSGMEPYSNTDGDYAEVTFYGTGLNVLGMHYDVNLSYSVDGGGSNAINFNSSSIFTNNNVKPFIIHNIVSGLSLGWHTVKIEKVSDAGNSTFAISGFEIVNEASQITVKAGKSHGNGYEYELATDQLIDYNLGFDNVLDVNVGTRGGRVVVYQDPSDGSIKKRLTKVDATSQFYTSADHTNEAIWRKVNYKEFGRNQSNDFGAGSINTTNTDRSFTLDDNSTTLVGFNIRQLENSLFLDNSTIYEVTLHFTGTGLDLYFDNKDGGAKQFNEIFVDEVLIANNVDQAAGEEGIIKICSGLPYGSHTVVFRNSGSFNSVINDFIIYQPKKPELPEGAIELAEYNIVADYVVNSSSGRDTIATGVIRKNVEREFKCVGTWNLDGNFEANGYIGGPQLHDASTTDGTASYTFFGTGFEIRHKAFSTYNSDIQISLNGTPLTAANFPTATFQDYGYTTGFDDTDGTLDMRSGSDVNGAGFSCSGLPLGIYTFTMAKNGSTNTMSIEAFDVITPIHTPHTTFGNKSLKDCRNFNSLRDVNKTTTRDKLAVSVDIGGNDNILKHSFNVSQVLRHGTSRFLIYFEEPMVDERYVEAVGITNGNQEYINFYTSGSFEAKTKNVMSIVTYNGSSGAESARDLQAISAFGKLEKEELEE